MTSGRSKPSPSPRRHRHGRPGLASGIVGSEQAGERGPDLAGVEETLPESAGPLRQLGVDVTPLAHDGGSAHLPRVAAEHHTGLEGHQVSGLHRSVPVGAAPRMLPRGDPGHVLSRRRRDSRRRHGLHEDRGQVPLRHAGHQRVRCHGESVLRDAHRGPNGFDLLGALDPAHLAEHRLTVDELGRRERLRQEVGRRTRHGVSGDPAGRGRALESSTAPSRSSWR